MRGQRLGITSDRLYTLSENHMEKALESLDRLMPKVLVVDSIQTLFTSNLSSIPGSISQVRETALRLISFSKRQGVTSFLVGHVTKEGTLAGPKVLEHMVDTVLYFEGEGGHPYRLLRAIKNRFRSTKYERR